MRLIQKNLRDHIIIAGYGVSNAKALEELLAARRGPAADRRHRQPRGALEQAKECGVAVLQGDASRNETLLGRPHRARRRALLISAGRDDSAILIVLTARKMAPRRQDQRHHPRSTTMRTSPARPAPTR